jgi:programmed cell death protein 5|tara:strand:- start:439 stop:774 length:336 start_codon:yes stop_codon:yes gene_type:complete
MEDPEGLKRKKLQELQAKLQEDSYRHDQIQQVEQQRRSILMEVLTSEARSRLGNVKLARPEFGMQVESFLIQLAQSGQVKQKVTDVQLKQILGKVQQKKRDIKIRTDSWRK